jgi:hypothetical protein
MRQRARTSFERRCMLESNQFARRFCSQALSVGSSGGGGAAIAARPVQGLRSGESWVTIKVRLQILPVKSPPTSRSDRFTRRVRVTRV